MSHSQLDEHLDALGVQLASGGARVARRRQRTRRIGAAAAAGSALAVAVLAVTAGTRDTVAEARAFLSDGTGILHYELVREHVIEAGPGDRRLAGGTTGRASVEVWSTLGQRPVSRWRWSDPPTPEMCGSTPVRASDGWLLIGRNTEATDSPALEQSYSPDARVLLKRRITPTERARRAHAYRNIPESRPTDVTEAVLGLSVADPIDPVSFLRGMLADGSIGDTGEVRRGDRALRRLQGTVGRLQRVPSSGSTVDPRTGRYLGTGRGSWWVRQPDQVTYLVDADTLAPVELRRRSQVVWSRAGGRLHIKWQQQILRFTRFERLPDTPAQRAASLTLRVPAGTRVAWQLDKPPVLRWGADARRQVSRLVRTEGQTIRARCLAAVRR